MDSKETGKLLEDIGRFAELMGIWRTVFGNRTGAKSAGTSQSPTPAITSKLVSPLSFSHFSAQNAKQCERCSLPSLVTCLSVGYSVKRKIIFHEKSLFQGLGYSVKRKIIFHEKSLFQGLRALMLGVQLSNICIL